MDLNNTSENMQFSVEHLFQSKGWDQSMLEPNEESFFYDIVYNGNKIGHFVIIKKKINYLPFSKLKITFGPFINYHNIDYVNYTVNYIKNVAKKHNALSIQIHPFTWGSNNKEIESIFLKHGFKRKPYYIYESSMVIDLYENIESIFKNFEGRGREAIRQSERRGITANKVEVTKETFDMFYKLYFDTCSRTLMIPDSKHKIWNILSHFSKEEKAYLFFSYYEDKPVSAFVSFKCGDCLSLIYQGSDYSEDIQKRRPANGLYWFTINWAKQNNFKWFDLAGVNANPKPGSKSEGIRLFKRQFGPLFVEFPGNYEFVYRKFWNYTINKIIPIYSKLALKRARKNAYESA